MSARRGLASKVAPSSAKWAGERFRGDSDVSQLEGLVGAGLRWVFRISASDPRIWTIGRISR